jgi:uncharacterized protein (TIGR03067 family)
VNAAEIDPGSRFWRLAMNRQALALLALGLLTAGGAARADDAPKDKLEGTWQVVQLESGGQQVPANGLQGMQVVITQDTLAIQLSPARKQLGTYRTDPTRKPKAIDLMATVGPDKGKTLTGIYQLDGGALKLCFSEPGKERPKGFATKKGSGGMCLSLKRARP